MNVNPLLTPIEVVEEIASTNVEMRLRGRAGAPHGAALRAVRQTSGRGQRSHAWSSPEGGLYLSVLIRPDVPSDALPALPIACSLGVLAALRQAGCHRVRLKWPNDIVVGTRKLAGILTELASSRDGLFAVCGIGVNMRAPHVSEHGRSVAALPPTGLLDELAPGVPEPSLDSLAESIRKEILAVVGGWANAYGHKAAYRGLGRPGTRVPDRDTSRWIDDPVRGGAEGPLAPLLAPYNACLAFAGEQVRVFAIDGEERCRGMFLGVDGYGHALVARQDGTVDTFNAVDVSIRPMAAVEP